MSQQRPLKKRIKYAMLRGLVRGLLFLAGKWPRKQFITACGHLGILAFRLLRDPREKTISNLTLIYGKVKTAQEIERMAKQVFKMVGMNVGDAFRSANMQRLEDFEEVTEVHGLENLHAALADGRGVIILSSHMGAFELIATYLAMMDLKPLIIGTPLKDPGLNAILTKNRERWGAEFVERGQSTLKAIRSLKNGRVVAMLIDQDTLVKSVFVDFMGVPASTPIGAALFAEKTGVSVVPIGIHLRKDLRQQLDIYRAIEMVSTGDKDADVLTNTEILTKASEVIIQKDPLQWLWMHERWKTRPS